MPLQARGAKSGARPPWQDHPSAAGPVLSVGFLQAPLPAVLLTAGCLRWGNCGALQLEHLRPGPSWDLDSVRGAVKESGKK